MSLSAESDQQDMPAYKLIAIRTTLDVMLEPILQQYSRSLNPDSIEPLGNAGGFSGAGIWKIRDGERVLCLRRWPQPHPSPSQLQWIHSVLFTAGRLGCSFIPVPIPSNEDSSFVSHQRHLWEVTTWLPGEADLSKDCSEEKLKSAFRALAEFHLATNTLSEPNQAPSPSMMSRREQANRFTESLRCLRPSPNSSPETNRRCAEIVELAGPRLPEVQFALQPIASMSFPLQPCLRDIWHQHVLFDGERLSGIIDFGAMRVDTIVLDLSRLIGSLRIYRPGIAQIALPAYETIRPLSELERQSVDANVLVASVLSGLHWVQWLWVDRRPFKNMDQVHDRLDEILRGLR